MKGRGRPKFEEEILNLSCKINPNQECYQFIKEKLKDVTKTQLLVQALNALQAIESGELYASFVPQVLKHLNVQLTESSPEPPLESTIIKQEVNHETTPMKENVEPSLDDYSEQELADLLSIIHSGGR